MRGQRDKYSHRTIYCKYSSSLSAHWQLHWSDYSPRRGFSLFFFPLEYSLFEYYSIISTTCCCLSVFTSLICIQIIFPPSFSPSMLKCRCSRGNWEKKKVACAKYTVGINKHFIRKRGGKPMYGGGAATEKKGEGEKDSIVLFGTSSVRNDN